MNATIKTNGNESKLTLELSFNQILDENFAEVCKAIELRGFFIKEMFKLLNEKPNVVEGMVRILTNSHSSKEAEKYLCKDFGISEITANYILNMPLSKLTGISADSLKCELDYFLACVASIR